MRHSIIVLEFKMKANEIFAEHVLSDSPMIKCYPFAPSCFKLQGAPPESQESQVEAIQWLLRNCFIPSIQKSASRVYFFRKSRGNFDPFFKAASEQSSGPSS